MPKNISWQRGFFRLWVVYGFIVVIATTATIYYITPFMHQMTLNEIIQNHDRLMRKPSWD